jgi:hypothetical protein
MPIGPGDTSDHRQLARDVLAAERPFGEQSAVEGDFGDWGEPAEDALTATSVAGSKFTDNELQRRTGGAISE